MMGKSKITVDELVSIIRKCEDSTQESTDIGFSSLDIANSLGYAGAHARVMRFIKEQISIGNIHIKKVLVPTMFGHVRTANRFFFKEGLCKPASKSRVKAKKKK